MNVLSELIINVSFTLEFCCHPKWQTRGAFIRGAREAKLRAQRLSRINYTTSSEVPESRNKWSHVSHLPLSPSESEEKYGQMWTFTDINNQISVWVRRNSGDIVWLLDPGLPPPHYEGPSLVLVPSVGSGVQGYALSHSPSHSPSSSRILPKHPCGGARRRRGPARVHVPRLVPWAGGLLGGHQGREVDESLWEPCVRWRWAVLCGRHTGGQERQCRDNFLLHLQPWPQRAPRGHHCPSRSVFWLGHHGPQVPGKPRTLGSGQCSVVTLIPL